MKKIYISLFLLFTIALSACAAGQGGPSPTPTNTPTPTPSPTIQPGDSERKLTVNGLERSYLLHIPPDLNSQQPVPVVFAFHGFTFNARNMQSSYGLDAVADVAGFLVVYPEGAGSSWNAGLCCGYALIHDVDEPAFVREMLSDLGTIATIDPKRIYATGFSNGAYLAYRLACEMPDIFAAIAPVAAAGDCQPEQAVSVMHVHGLTDKLSPYTGGTVYIGGARVEVPPVESVIATWVQLADCTGPVQVEKLDDMITHTTHTSCQASTAVELYTMDSAGHFWPLMPTFPVSEIIWDFFAAHPKP